MNALQTENYSDYIDDSIALTLLNKGEEVLDTEYLSPCSEATRSIVTSLDLIDNTILS